jgi:alkylation response protein AidB-like acyl-CoA dehydrogenase
VTVTGIDGEEIALLRETARRFVARECNQRKALEWDRARAYPREVFDRIAGMGWYGIGLDDAEWGSGGALELMVVAEELGRASTDLVACFSLTSSGLRTLVAHGTEEQKASLIPRIMDGSLRLSVAVTEPDAGSDAASIATTAKRVDGGYVLDGQKTWISNGGVAELYVVFATVERGSGHRGITAFLLHRDDEGLSFGQPMRKMGQRAIVNTELFLSDCLVPDDRRLGGEGEGFRGLMQTFDRSRVTLAAAATGLARAALEYATQYAKERRQFGRPIAEHQAVAFRVADMALRVDASRLLTWRAAHLLDAGRTATTEAAMAKLHASETAMFCTWAAVQTLGGWGYSREYPVEKWMRDAKLEEIEEGTSDIQRLIVSRGVLRGV